MKVDCLLMLIRQMVQPLIFMRRYLGYLNEFLNRGPMNDVERTEILKRRDTHDRNEKLLDQLLWLKECGFSDVDVIYRNRTFIVTVARKGN